MTAIAPRQDTRASSREWLEKWGEVERVRDMCGGDPTANASTLSEGERGSGRGNPGDIGSLLLIHAQVDVWVKKQAINLIVLARQIWVYGWEDVEKEDEIQAGDQLIKVRTGEWRRQNTFSPEKMESPEGHERMLEQWGFDWKAWLSYNETRILRNMARELNLRFE